MSEGNFEVTMDVGGPRYMPPPPKKDNPWALRGIAAVIAVGIFIAGAVAGASTTETPAPEVRTETKTVTETVTVEETPSSCLDALDAAELIFVYAADGFKAASNGFAAAGRFDVQGILAANADMRAAVRDVGSVTPEWRRARNACRASA